MQICIYDLYIYIDIYNNEHPSCKHAFWCACHTNETKVEIHISTLIHPPLRFGLPGGPDPGTTKIQQQLGWVNMEFLMNVSCLENLDTFRPFGYYRICTFKDDL